MSMSDVSEMLLEMRKANVSKAKVSKAKVAQRNKGARKTPPTSTETSTSPPAITHELLTASKNLQGDEMIANQSVVASGAAATSFHPGIKYSATATATSLPKTAVQNAAGFAGVPSIMPKLTAIPTSVLVRPATISVVPQANLQAEEIDVKPLIHPTTGLVITPAMPTNNAAAAAASVIQPVPNNTTISQAIAAALLRDGYHNFQQQMRAQELMKQQHLNAHLNADVLPSSSAAVSAAASAANQLLENFLRQSRQATAAEAQEHNNAVAAAAASDTNDGNGDDEDGEDSRYNSCFDELIDSTKPLNGNTNGVNHYPTTLYQSTDNGAASTSSATADYYSDESQKLMIAAQQVQVQALRNLEYSLGGGGGGCGASNVEGDYASNGLNPDGSIPDGMLGEDGEPIYECHRCSKKYRWKSTLRRHESVECGGKEPSHQCPYCPYRSKQRGNLGVHVRKHHSTLPQLASKRRSKYSTKLEDGSGDVKTISVACSEDSSNKLIIDCSLGENQYNNNNNDDLNGSMPSNEVQGEQ